MSVYHNNSMFNNHTYHVADLDKSAPNRLWSARDDNNNGDHNMTRKSTGHNNVVPVYSNEVLVNPALKHIPRFADDRHRVLENRRQAQFHRTNGGLITERPLN